MNNKKWLSCLVLSVVLLVGLACNFSASTAKIKDAKMARDNEGTQPTTTFAANDVFYCNLNLANAPDDTSVKAVWTAVAVEGIEPNTKIDESELKSGSDVLHFKLTNQNAWPAGKYKVDLYLNDKLDQTLEFTVE
jgi:hypothetical protein